MRLQIQATWLRLAVVIFLCVQSIVSHGSHGGFKPGGISHDHEHETDEHRDYEKNVLLGEEEEGAGYDELTREEKVQRLLKIAKKIDFNADDSLTEEELKKWVQENHMKYLLKNAVDYIADVDLNNDSKMSFKEYEDSHFVPGTPGMPKDFRNTTRYRHGKRRFEYADLNKDGHLSMHEFLYFLNPEEGKHMRKCLVLETIENMDLDGDGALNIKDYIGEGILEMKSGDEFVAKVKEFKEYDKNVDGLLVEDEVRDWMFPPDFSSSKHEVEHIMSHGDKDKDGKMSYDEFSSIPEHLEHSRATGYGDMFQENKDEL